VGCLDPSNGLFAVETGSDGLSRKELQLKHTETFKNEASD